MFSSVFKLPVFFTLLVVFGRPLFAEDMPGTQDPISMPRVADAEIIGYERSEYDAGALLVLDEADAVVVSSPEGKRHRVLYLAAEGDTPLKIQRNYQAALAELGAVTETYSCTATACDAHQLATTLWTRDTMLPTHNLKQPFYLLGFAHVFTSPSYRSAVVTSETARFHVGVFSAVLSNNNSNTEQRGRTVILVEVLEDADFVPTLTFVDAAAMESEIETTGRVALYGIQFDHDSATIKDSSAPTLNEILAYLRTNNISLYVVGHTDDVGALAYNQSLAQKRAEAVVGHLTSAGVDGGRLTALGVGPAAPVASNDNDAGRAENRRVELVKRLDR